MNLERVIVDRCGLMESARVCYALLRWYEAALYLDKFPTTAEVASFHGKSERTAWHWRSRLRGCMTENELQAAVTAMVAEFRRNPDARLADVKIRLEKVA
jgi:hypothetical protein